MSTAWHVLSLTFIAGLVSQNSLGLLDLQLCLFGFAGLWGNRLHVEGSEWGNAARCVCVCVMRMFLKSTCGRRSKECLNNATHTDVVWMLCLYWQVRWMLLIMSRSVSRDLYQSFIDQRWIQVLAFITFYRHYSSVGSMSLDKIKYVGHILLACG